MNDYMINPPADDVLVELSNGNISGDGDSPSKEDGSISITNIDQKWPKLMEEIFRILRQQKQFINEKWKMIFTMSSAWAVFIDPLICYVPVIIEDSTCYYWDKTLMWTFFALRSALDLFYAMDIAVFWRRSRRKGNDHYANSFRASCMKAIPKPLRGDKSLMILRIIPRICASLPIEQALILLGKYTNNSKLFYLIPIQYTLRSYNLCRLLNRHANVVTPIRRLFKALLDFLPFILAAHLFGALWYFFAVSREIHCWQGYLCDHENICDRATIDDFFYCSSLTPQNNDMINTSLLKQMSCPLELSKNVTSLPFDFGIYLYALQSNLTRSRDLPKKILQCLWWGFRNLSSFGSNLQTSFYNEEIIFSLVISVIGLALFLVYLNSRVEASQKISDQLQLRKKINITYSNIIYKMREMRRLRLDSLKKVPMLEGIDKNVLKAISEHLEWEPVTYSDGVYIFREREPLRKMLFLTRGSALTYTSSFSSTGTSSCTCLVKGDYYGEELINWAFNSASFYDLPISTRSVVSQKKVEAFSITANDLKSVVNQFWWHFKKDQVPHSQLEHFAAFSIQAAWRRYLQERRALLEAGVIWGE